MADAFHRYLSCHVRHVLVLFFIHKIWCLQNRNYYQQFQNKLSCTIKYLNQKFHETIAESQKYELNECHTRHVTHMTGEMEKIQSDFKCLFFQSGKKSIGKALISIKLLLFLKAIMASCAWLWQWGLSGSSVFTLKTPTHHAIH